MHRINVAAFVFLWSWQTCLCAQVPTASHRWQGAVIYEINPRSFHDSNRDGIGDLTGITSGLDYLKSLSIDAIWTTPIFPSPLAHLGHDVSNYRDAAPEFGTTADFEYQSYCGLLVDLLASMNHGCRSEV
jgi:hypothetical protein